MTTILDNNSEIPMGDYFGDEAIGGFRSRLRKVMAMQDAKKNQKPSKSKFGKNRFMRRSKPTKANFRRMKMRKFGLHGEENMDGLWDSLTSTASKTWSNITNQAQTAASTAVKQATTSATQAVQSTTQKAQESLVSQSQLLTNKALTSVGLQQTAPKPQPVASTPAKVVSTATNVNTLAVSPTPSVKKAAIGVGTIGAIALAGFLFWKFALNKKG